MLPDLRTLLIWVLGAGLVVALITAGVERTRSANAREDLAAEKADRAKENTARALAALAEVQRLTGLVAAHAKNQQENVHAFETRLQTLGARQRAVAADRDRLRKLYTDYAAHDRNQVGSDPSACQRVEDRSALLGAMAARSRELLERGRLIVEGRDNEVQLLLDTVKNDRALLQAPACTSGS